MPQRWPLHPPPFPHESLSSWLERQASCYRYRSEDLLRYDLGFPALSSEQLDINPSPMFLERLAERSGFSVERLRSLTIQGWVPQLIDSLKPDAGSYPKYVREYALLYPTEFREYQAFQDWVPWTSAHRMGGKAACRFCLREDPSPSLLPEQTSAPPPGEVSSYEQAWGKAHTAMEEVAITMRQDLQTAIQMRQILLGFHPTPKRIEEIDHLFREQGYLLPDDVI